MPDIVLCPTDVTSTPHGLVAAALDSGKIVIVDPAALHKVKL
jgi:hypothetical protein